MNYQSVLEVYISLVLPFRFQHLCKVGGPRSQYYPMSKDVGTVNNETDVLVKLTR